MSTPDEFDADETLNLPPPPTIEEGDIEQVPDSTVGSEITLQKILAPSGAPVNQVLETSVQAGRHAPKHGIWKGQPMYYERGGHFISGIDHIDRMSDGSFWVHTQNSVYRVEMLNDVGMDTITEIPAPDADEEAGGNPAGDGRLETRNDLDGLVGEEGGGQ